MRREEEERRRGKFTQRVKKSILLTKGSIIF
jgi:hypothetical protein